jgi:glycosyl-4,4'-diaponeurosporenoate acyltransferase
MLRLLMPQAVTLVVDVAAWGAIHSATGYLAFRLDGSRLREDGWLLRVRRFEEGGRWYRRRLRIHRWKDRLT